MDLEQIKAALEQLDRTEVVALKKENDELKAKLAVIAQTVLNGSFNPAPAEALVEARPKQKLGKAPKRKNGSRGHLDDATRKLIGEAYKANDGRTVREISKEFKVSPYTIYSTLKKAGVERRRGA